MSQLPLLHPISTTYKVSCSSAIVHLVPSFTTFCNSQQYNDDTQARLARIEAAFNLLTLGYDPRRQVAYQSTIQLPIYGASADAVPQFIMIPTQIFLLMPVVPLDGAVATAPGQRQAQPPPPAGYEITYPPPPARPEWNPDDRDLLLRSANRFRFTEVSGVRIRAFLEDAENFLEMCGHPRDYWARIIISWLGANEPEKVRCLYFLVTSLITPLSKMASSRFSVGSSLSIRIANSCASSLKQAQNPWPSTPRAGRTSRHMLTRTLLQNCSSTLQSSTSSQDRATPRHATIYGVSAHAAALADNKRSIWRKPASFHAPRTDLCYTPPSLVTRRARRMRTPHRAPRRQTTIAQS